MRLNSDRVWQALLAAGALSAVGAGIYGLFVRPMQESWRVAQAVPAGSRLIDAVMPIYEFRGVTSTVIRATPEQIFRALSTVTLADMPMANWLIYTRYLPSQLAGQAKDQTPSNVPIRKAIQGSGNIVLAEAPNRELVVGAIGKFHSLVDQHPVMLQNPRQFAFFVNPAFQKLAMSWSIAGGNDQDGYRFVMENRTHALSARSRRQFALYWWLMIRTGSDIMSRLLVSAVKQRAEEAQKLRSMAGSDGTTTA